MILNGEVCRRTITLIEAQRMIATGLVRRLSEQGSAAGALIPRRLGIYACVGGK
jgi:hypothetical protein